jgi:hypothetical protein
MFSIHGSWLVNINNAPHTLEADLNVSNQLRVYLDEGVIHESYIFYAQGEVHRFQMDGQNFVLSINGLFRPTMSFTLAVDGQEIVQASKQPQLPGTYPPQPFDSTKIQIIREQNVVERTEVVDTQDYPLDNLAGSDVLTNETEITRTVTNELSMHTGIEVAGNLKLKILSLVEADISAQLTKQNGQTLGQTITERRTLTFTVQPQNAVVYTVIWLRKVRSGEYVVSTDGNPLLVPYNVYYGLSYQVKSRKP